MSETVKCGLCNGFTGDVVYRGRLQCCGVRVFFGRCCKEKAVMLFDTLGAAGVAFGKLHTFICEKKNEIIVDETVSEVEKEVEKEPKQSSLPSVLDAVAFKAVCAAAAGGGQVVDGGWVLVIPRSGKSEMVSKIFGSDFTFETSPRPTQCRVDGDFLGIFEGVPVVARWDLSGNNAILCRQSVIGDKPDGTPPN